VVQISKMAGGGGIEAQARKNLLAAVRAARNPHREA